MPRVPASVEKLRPFDQVVAIGNGLVDPRKPEFRDRLHVGPDNISSESGRIVHPLQTARELGLKSGKFPFEAGDILYSKIRPNLNKVAIADVDGICSADMYVLKPKGIDRSFLFHSLRAEFFYKQAVAASMRSGLPKVNRDDLSMMELKVPPPPEQRRIAAILDEWDKAIAATEKLVEAKKIRLLAVTDRLLFDAASEIPIGSVAIQTARAAGEDFQAFEVLSCTKHDGLVLSDNYFGKQVYGNDRRTYKVVADGEFAYATNHLEEGSIGQNTTGISGIVSPMYTTFRAEGINAKYLRLILKTERLRREFQRRTPASVNRRGGLRWNDFVEIQIPYHLENEQAAIADTLSGFESELTNQAELTTKWRLQKRGLMQKLLSGDWSVSASIDRLLPAGEEVDDAVGAEVQRAEAAG